MVGVSDYIPHTIGAKYFLTKQGYNLVRNIFYQDNLSTIKMIKNGKQYCGGKSRHIHIRYFFTKDILKREDMTVKHCPTKQMIANYFTKPIQGKQFYELRKVIMGINNTLVVKECVETKVKRNQRNVRTKK